MFDHQDSQVNVMCISKFIMHPIYFHWHKVSARMSVLKSKTGTVMCKMFSIQFPDFDNASMCCWYKHVFI